MQYSQTLISRDKESVPVAASVREFLVAIVKLGVVPGELSIVLRKPNGKTREYPSPIPGRTMIIELKDREQVGSLADIEPATAGLLDYEVEISGEGQPACPPIPIDFTEPYCIGVTVFVSSTLRSTSNFHEECGANREVPFFGERCEDPASMGVFNHPESLELIEIPEAGAARFWIQFELGKFLFPEIKAGNLALLNPDVVKLAESIFGIRFVQGCFWG